MSLKELNEAKKAKKVSYGVKQVLKLAKKKKLGKTSRVFVCRDTREGVLKELEKAGVEFEVLKNKRDVSRELELDFDSEVFLIK
jgi:ribosomal protein L7Ae-like RNA K-turn-binding protein